MKTSIFAALALVLALVLGAFVTPASACGGNSCPASNSDWVAGGGWTEGGGEGFGNAGSNYTGGDVTARGAMAESMTGFTGSFRFATDECGTCEEDSNAVFGEGFSTQRAGSFIETNGGSASAGSNSWGVGGGEGFSWSNRDK